TCLSLGFGDRIRGVGSAQLLRLRLTGEVGNAAPSQFVFRVEFERETVLVQGSTGVAFSFQSIAEGNMRHGVPGIQPDRRCSLSDRGVPVALLPQDTS